MTRLNLELNGETEHLLNKLAKKRKTTIGKYINYILKKYVEECNELEYIGRKKKKENSIDKDNIDINLIELSNLKVLLDDLIDEFGPDVLLENKTLHTVKHRIVK